MSTYDDWKLATPPEYSEEESEEEQPTPPKPKVRHIVSNRVHCPSTERDEVIAFCGYSEEAGGSGRHTVDVGDVECLECVRRALKAYPREEE